MIAVTGPERCTLFVTRLIVPDTAAPDPGDASTGACRTTSGPTLKLRAAEKRPTVLPLVARARQKYVFAPASFGSATLVVAPAPCAMPSWLKTRLPNAASPATWKV